MAADQDRAERIRQLKRNRPDLKWRVIADHVGVTERAAASWAQNGGIAYDNAKKLAEIFEVDVDYIMRGDPSAPDLFGAASADGRLDDLEERLDRIESMLETLLEHHGLAYKVTPRELQAGHEVARLAGEAAQRRPGTRTRPGEASGSPDAQEKQR